MSGTAGLGLARWHRWPAGRAGQGLTGWRAACSSRFAVPRIPRRHLVDENSTNHCTWRSHGYSLVLDSDDAREEFLALLRKYKEKFGIQIHSYCLMGTHPHVMCKATRGQNAFSNFWKVVNWKFARWYNRRTNGRGQVVMERLRSPPVQDGRHQLEVMRYGDLN